jgi:ABC-type Mn2+/Zn2+ transport system ATPase subunit
MIHLSNTTFGYRRHPVIHCGELHIRPSSCLGIYGANGSGKTTLLRGIAGVLPPLGGTLSREPKLSIALVPQRQGFDPLWPMTAFDAASLAISAQSPLGWLGAKTRRIHEALEQIGVAHLAQCPFRDLSGGQQQRILLAGALACRPRVLLLDEPADGLDARTTDSLLEILRRLAHTGTALVMISHEAGELAQVADTFAWVELADSPHTPNELLSLSREDFLNRALGIAPFAPSQASN